MKSTLETPVAKRTMTKAELCDLLAKFINQRSGIEFENYQSGDWKASREAFMGDYRPMLRAGRDARAMLRAVRLRESITADNLREATRAYSGRLQFTDNGIDYTTGQYFPTEYRNAACAVLASALWSFWRENMPASDGKQMRGHGSGTFYRETEHETYGGLTAGEYIRKQARNEFGRGIASRWFN